MTIEGPFQPKLFYDSMIFPIIFTEMIQHNLKTQRDHEHLHYLSSHHGMD